MKILIKGGTVYDGTGTLPRIADVLIENEKFVSVESGSSKNKNICDVQTGDTTVINAGGMVVCPGFIDIHRHADAAVFNLPDFGKTELLQGITSVIVGNCGISPVPGKHQWQREHFRYIEPVVGPVTPDLPVAGYLQYREGLENVAKPVNFGFLAGAGAIKTAVKGFSKQPFSGDEMAAAKRLVSEAFDSGAFGLSFGVMYQPECYSSHDEMTALARTAAANKSETVLCFHIRGEGDSLVESIEEVIRIAQSAGLKANISHFKATGIKNWQNLIFKAIEKIETARDRGLEITADFYPYDGGSTTILSLLPPVLMEDSIEALCAKLAGRDGSDLLRREISRTHPGWDNMAMSIGWDRIIVSSVSLPSHNGYCGRSLKAIALEEGFDDPCHLLRDLIVSEEGKVGIIVLSMNQNDIDTIARLPWTCLISDSLYNRAANPHPRLNGAFPKFLREYVKERRLLSMEEVIRKMTGIPAERMGLKNRGRILPGYAADVLVFDPGKFTDNAVYSNPKLLAGGMGTVILNGKIVYANGVFHASNGLVLP